MVTANHAWFDMDNSLVCIANNLKRSDGTVTSHFLAPNKLIRNMCRAKIYSITCILNRFKQNRSDLVINHLTHCNNCIILNMGVVAACFVLSMKYEPGNLTGQPYILSHLQCICNSTKMTYHHIERMVAFPADVRSLVVLRTFNGYERAIQTTADLTDTIPFSKLNRSGMEVGALQEMA